MRRALLVAAIALIVAPQALALDRKGADAAALAALKPQTIPGRIVVYGLDAPLPAGSVVAEAVGAGKGVPVAKTAGKAWLYWADLAHGALYEHPSFVILVDDRTGKAQAPRALSWWPLVDGKLPAFLGADAKVARYSIWTNVPGLKARTPAAAARVLLPAAGADDRFADDCLFRIGDRTPNPNSPELFGHSLIAVRQWADAAGLKNEGASTERDLQLKVSAAIAAGCKDVAIFLAGHGSPEHDTPFPGRPDAMVRGVAEPTVELGGGAKVTAKGLRIIMGQHPETTFKLMIFSCFSGRFVTALEDVKNLAVVSASSSATEYSWGYIEQGYVGGFGVTAGQPLRNPANDPVKLPGYVFGLLGALTNVTASSPDLDLAGVIAQAHTSSARNDFAAKLGWTHPAAYALPPRLRVSPIAANFVQAEFATHYDVLVANAAKPVTYAWKLTPPTVDPGCDNRGRPTSSADEFVWVHGDQHGCDHTKQGPKGHLGTVTVTVSDGVWACTLSYFGTETGAGSPGICKRV